MFCLTFTYSGSVARADIMTESGGRSKGCGTVLFESPEDAAHAISILFVLNLSKAVGFLRCLTCRDS